MRKLLTTGALVATSIGLSMSPAAAATQQGLVNVNLEGIIVQAPVGVAANVCDVTAAVLAVGIVEGPATCVADADSDAVAVSRTPGRGTRQEGLVNLNVEDVTIQVPIAVAANVCDVTIAVLSGAIADGPTTCSAIADSVTTA